MGILLLNTGIASTISILVGLIRVVNAPAVVEQVEHAVAIFVITDQGSGLFWEHSDAFVVVSMSGRYSAK